MSIDNLDDNPILELSEGTVFGSTYITVRPNFSFNRNNFLVQSWYDMECWCITQFGPTPEDGVWTPNARWYMNNEKFWFRDQTDLSWFILRWS